MSVEVSDVNVEQWRDRKRHLWLMGLIAPTALFVMLPLIWALNQAGWHALAQVPLWIGPGLLYVLLPILDLKFGPDGENPPDEMMDQLANDKYYRYCTYVYIPFQYASVIMGAYLFTAKDLSWLGFEGGLAWWAKLGVALSVGVLGGVGINTAHEMGHKKENLERWLAKITLAQTFYGHFYIEHNRGHHVRVATPEDPASARFGETFWEFLPRTVWGALKSSVELEAQVARANGATGVDRLVAADADRDGPQAVDVVARPTQRVLVRACGDGEDVSRRSGSSGGARRPRRGAPVRATPAGAAQP